MELAPEVWRAHTDSRCSHLNVGTGVDVSVAELARLVAEVVGFEGEIVFDTSKPDGMPQKLLDVERLRGLGWAARIALDDGIRHTYRWFLEHQGQLRL
jgi:GDP-L-fucose synthase